MVNLVTHTDVLGNPLLPDAQALIRGPEQWVLIDDPQHLVGALLPPGEVHIRTDGQPGFQVKIITLWTAFAPGLFASAAVDLAPAFSTMVTPTILLSIPALYVQHAELQMGRRKTARALGIEIAELSRAASPTLKAAATITVAELYPLSTQLVFAPVPQLAWLNELEWRHIAPADLSRSLSWWALFSSLLWPWHSAEMRERPFKPMSTFAARTMNEFVSARSRAYNRMVAAGALDGDAMVSLLREVVWPEALFDPVLRLEDDGMDQIDDLFTYSFGTDEDRKLVLKSRLLLVLSAYPDLGDLFGRQGGAEKNGRVEQFQALCTYFVNARTIQASGVLPFPTILELAKSSTKIRNVLDTSPPTDTLAEVVSSLCSAELTGEQRAKRVAKVKPDGGSEGGHRTSSGHLGEYNLSVLEYFTNASGSIKSTMRRLAGLSQDAVTNSQKIWDEVISSRSLPLFLFLSETRDSCGLQELQNLTDACGVARWRDYLVARLCFSEGEGKVPNHMKPLVADVTSYMPAGTCKTLLDGSKGWQEVDWHKELVTPYLTKLHRASKGTYETVPFSQRYTTVKYMEELLEVLPIFLKVAGAEVDDSAEDSLSSALKRAMVYAKRTYHQSAETRAHAVKVVTTFLDAVLLSASEMRAKLRKAPSGSAPWSTSFTRGDCMAWGSFQLAEESMDKALDQLDEGTLSALLRDAARHATVSPAPGTGKKKKQKRGRKRGQAGGDRGRSSSSSPSPQKQLFQDRNEKRGRSRERNPPAGGRGHERDRKRSPPAADRGRSAERDRPKPLPATYVVVKADAVEIHKKEDDSIVLAYSKEKVIRYLKEIYPKAKPADICWPFLLCRNPKACDQEMRSHKDRMHDLPNWVLEKVRNCRDAIMRVDKK